MNAALSKAARVQPFVVFGRKLKDYSLWHQILLEELQSGWAINSKYEKNLEDLLISVYFCSFDYAGGLDQLSSHGFRRRIAFWGWRAGKYDPIEEMGKFSEYIESYRHYPDYWVENPRDGSVGGISFAQFLKVKLMQEFHVDEATALNTPYNDAAWSFLAAMEARGLIRIMTDEDGALIQKVKASEDLLQKLAEKYASTVSTKNRAGLN